jgi:hypothetical protein
MGQAISRNGNYPTMNTHLLAKMLNVMKGGVKIQDVTSKYTVFLVKLPIILHPTCLHKLLVRLQRCCIGYAHCSLQSDLDG